jgi:hypothetical protein
VEYKKRIGKNYQATKEGILRTPILKKMQIRITCSNQGKRIVARAGIVLLGMMNQFPPVGPPIISQAVIAGRWFVLSILEFNYGNLAN